MDTSTKNKVAFATGSRADYGIVRRYLKLLDDDPAIDLSILVTGALLEQAYGHQVDIVKEDGFSIGVEVPLGIDSLSEIGVAHSMARALEGFSAHFADNKYDLLIILGDRYEMLSVATAAAMQRIPILHIHGGEATFANYDEFIRHAITKMSLYHFTATEEYRRRVIQLGEEPDRVFNLGALGAEIVLWQISISLPPALFRSATILWFSFIPKPCRRQTLLLRLKNYSALSLNSRAMTTCLLVPMRTHTQT